ncbi:16803_t:CDS:2, partial [Gigaspora margarita]
MKAQAQMHFAEKRLYLTCGEKMSVVLISTNSGPLVESIVKHPESENTFDKFEYEDEVLDEAEEKELAHAKLLEEKDIFSQNMNDLGQTDIIIHKIVTGTVAPIKQAPYHAAP